MGTGHDSDPRNAAAAAHLSQVNELEKNRDGTCHTESCGLVCSKPQPMVRRTEAPVVPFVKGLSADEFDRYRHAAPAHHARTRVPGREPARAQGRRRPRCRRRLHGLARRDQCAELRRPELRRDTGRDRHRVRARPRDQGTAGAQHLRDCGQHADVARRGRSRGGRGRRRPDPGRCGAAAVRLAHPSVAAPAPVGPGLGNQPSRDQFLPRAVRHPACGAAPRALDQAGRGPDPARQAGSRCSASAASA